MFGKHKNISIRDFRDSDYPAVLKLWAETNLGGAERGDNAQTIEKTIATGGKLLIMEHADNEGIIGTSWLTTDGRRMYLHHFGIAPAQQGKHYSIPLLEASIAFAKKQNLQLKLEVHKDNFKAVRLYKKFKFKYLGDYHVYIIRKLQTTIINKQLKT